MNIKLKLILCAVLISVSSLSFDALFDRHLISFENDGSILISDKVSEEDKGALGVSESIRIPISEGMIPYLEGHRQRFERL